MKTFKTNFLTLLTAFAILIAFAFSPTLIHAASATDPYCRISYDTAVGCNTVKYYAYKDGTAYYDSSRLVKFYNGQILLGTSNTVVTSAHKSGTNPAWNSDGSYLVWIETDNAIYCRQYGGNTNTKLADGVTSLGLNAESMVTTVSFSDNSSKSISDLLSGNSDTVPSETSPSSSEANTSSSSSPSASTTTSITEWTDSAGVEHWNWDFNSLWVDGSDVFINNYKVSELCTSGVKFVGIDKAGRVYLYEDSTASFYRFNVNNLFQPDKIRFANGTTISSVMTDANGYLTEVVTSSGTYTIAQLVADRVWYPAVSYCVNKSGYCSYYVAETSKVITLTLKGNKLYIGSKLIAKGIKRKTDSFGCKGKYYYFVKGSKAYKGKISAPTKAKVWKKNVKKLTYNTSNGLVSGAK